MRTSQRIRWVFRLLAVAMVAVRLIVARNQLTPDGISYIEIARAYLRHDWAMTVNAYWGPLFAWLLVPVLGIFKPSIRWEIPMTHLLQFFVFLGGLAAFEFFWANLLMAGGETEPSTTQRPSVLPNEILWALGYSFFLWTTLPEIVSLINPDLLLFVEVLLIAGILCQTSHVPAKRWWWYISLGLLLGAGYLTKAVMFPVGFAILVISFVCSRERRHALRLTVAGLVFLTVALPEVTLLSHTKGRLTFSDTGKLAFAWFTYGLPRINWQGTEPDSGIPRHPTRKIHEHPPVYEFRGPIRATYPPWYDPSYWNDGMSPRLKPMSVVKHAVHGLIAVACDFVFLVPWVIGVGLLLISCNIKRSLQAMHTASTWILPTVSILACGMYSLTLVSSRYLAAWELLFWGGILVSLRGIRLSLRACRVLGATIAITVTISTVIYVRHLEVIHGPRDDAGKEYAMAETLKKMGMRPGDKVASIAYGEQVQWAHLDQLSIVTEVSPADICKFWNAGPAVQDEVLKKFAEAGAQAVIANAGGGVRVGTIDLTCVHPNSDWQRIDGSLDYVRLLH
jgi:hypothetical protein